MDGAEPLYDPLNPELAELVKRLEKANRRWERAIQVPPATLRRSLRKALLGH